MRSLLPRTLIATAATVVCAAAMPAVADEPSAPIELTDSQMDAVTAGTPPVGFFPSGILVRNTAPTDPCRYTLVRPPIPLGIVEVFGEPPNP